MKIKFLALSLCLLMPLAGHATGIPCASCAIGESHGYGTPVIDVNADVNAIQQLIAEQQNKEISNPKK